MKNILILGSKNNAALSIAQDLGHIYNTHAFGFKEDFNKVEYSKYLNQYKQVSKSLEFKALCAAIIEYVQINHIELIIPTNDRFAILMSMSNIRKILGNVTISTPEYDMLIKGMDKFESSKMANKHGICVPKIYSWEEFHSQKFPVYLKSRLSWAVNDDNFENGSVKRINSKDELLRLENAIQKEKIYIQEEVSGVGWGLEILSKDGELLNYFAHQRVRESNPKGGYSSVAMSIHPNPFYIECVKSILAELNWTGVAMFEFKGDPKGKASYFIEMNCRFWGSLPVALHAGNRFPSLMINVFEHKKVEQVKYREHVLAQWFIADIIHFIKLVRLKNRSQYNLPSVYKTFIGVFFTKMKNYNIYQGDWKPNFYELTKGVIRKFYD